MIVKGQSKKNMEAAVEIILAGGLVAFPTETVYGLGADATNESAVARIFKLKERPFEDPLIVHVADFRQLEQIAHVPQGLVREAVDKLAARFWPGPLTLVLKKRKEIPLSVTGGLDTVAVRVPRHLIAMALIKNTGKPLAAPSANKFQSLSPTTAEAVEKELGPEVMILDGGPCAVGVESTVLSFENDIPVILRHGGVPREKLEYVLGMPVAKAPLSAKIKASPGMMDFHYAPGKPLKVMSGEELEILVRRSKREVSRTALLCFSKSEKRKFAKCGFASVTDLSPRGRLDEAARHLFEILRKLDEGDAKKIAVLEFPDEELGVALNDRVRKAEHE